MLDSVNTDQDVVLSFLQQTGRQAGRQTEKKNGKAGIVNTQVDRLAGKQEPGMDRQK